MPRSDMSNPVKALSSRGRGYNHLSPEEAAGIAILVVVVAVLLIFGCWYYRRRSGYNILQNYFGPATVRSLMGNYREQAAPVDIKVPLHEFSNLNPEPVIPDAPPAYNKIAAGSVPPPYSP
ncbi:melanoma antigen recognized by T-cells 1 isoform X2 [Rhinatrema bivittatum]|nr:melanoma antigen recognized by T-cells 1 isoform X2 [Rhinatrema bivittatum]XP_029469794.1 melanoma antigen recognized by T-cells 1 isoform X2 [Rhinatrema bivittatum]